MYIYFFGFTISLIIFVLISKGMVIKNKVGGRKENHLIISRVSFALFWSAIPPTLIAALRYDVGTDYFPTYYTGFYRILENSKVDRFEIGYYYFNKIIQLFTDNAFALFIITSILFVGISYKAIGDLSINIPFSIVLFFVTRYYFIGLNAVRQYIAMAILLHSIKYIQTRNLKKFLLCILCACIFHYTSIIFILTYFIGRIDVTKKQFIILSIGDVLVCSIGVTGLKYILGNSKYGVIINTIGVAGVAFSVITIIINLIIVIYAFTNKEKNKDDTIYLIYFNIQLVAFWVSLILRFLPAAERVYWIFSFPIIVSLPYFISHGNKYRKIFKYIIILIYLIYMIYDIVILKDHNVIPYNWIFGKESVYDSGWIKYKYLW